MSVSSIMSAASVALGADRSDEIRMVTRSYQASEAAKGGPPCGLTLTLNRDGDLLATGDAGDSVSGTPNADEWHRDNTGATLGDDWDVRATLTAGTTPTTGTMSPTWQRLNANRAWYNSATGGATKTSTITFDFRLNGETTVLATVTGVVISAVSIAI